MGVRWRRGCLVSVLACCTILALVGGLMFAGIKSNRLYLNPPAELLDLGPIWFGDFCRDNVAHGRYPPGWCPDDYTLYVVLRLGSRGSIHRILSIPDTTSSLRSRQ